MERIVQLTIGDWSGDGHSQTKQVIVKISGADVSDDRLKNNREAAARASNVKLENICKEYEDATIITEDLQQLVNAGIIDLDDERLYAGNQLGIWVDAADFKIVFKESIKAERIDSVALIMAYAGYTLDDFQWERLEFDTVLGNHRAPLGSFGYGLFYN